MKLRPTISAPCLFLAAIATIAGAQGGKTRLDSQRTLGAARSYRNLTLIPVYDSTAVNSDKYLTLDDGLRSKRVTVAESSNGGDVNTLYVTNRSDKPLYLLAGEVVLGGQQDRCLGQDTIVQPGKKRIPVAVFCVEHGRWTGRAEFDSSAGTVASQDVRSSAQNGAFKAAAASSPVALGGMVASGRRTARVQSNARPDIGMAAAATSNAQQEVWDKVASKNARFKAEPATGTYRTVLNLSGGEAGKSIGPYVKALGSAMDKDPSLVGVFAAVNGKVVAADIFGEPALFRKLWPKLLRSYAADAAEHAPGVTKDSRRVSAGEARSFFLEASDAKQKATIKTPTDTTIRLESKDMTLFKLSIPAGGGRVLHENVIRK